MGSGSAIAHTMVIHVGYSSVESPVHFKYTDLSISIFTCARDPLGFVSMVLSLLESVGKPLVNSVMVIW